MINLFPFNFNYKPKVDCDTKDVDINEFKEFLSKIENDLNNCLLVFLKANGYTYKEVKKSKKSLGEIFQNNDSYYEFLELHKETKEEIEKVLYTGETSFEAKKLITDYAFKEINYIQLKYPGVKTNEKIEGKNYTSLFIFIIFIIIFFLMDLGKS